MKDFRATRRLLTTFALVTSLMIDTTVEGSASETSSSGVITVHSNPCLMAKYGIGQPCKLPVLPDANDSSQLAEAHVARAEYFIELEELKQALSETDAALRIDPDNISTRHLAARLAMSMGNYLRAERDIATALRKAPTDPDILASQAALLALEQRTDEAVDLYGSILDRHPDHAFSRLARTKLFLADGKPQQAVDDLTVLLTGDDPDPMLWSLRARAYLQMGAPELAVADYSKALVQRPNEFSLASNRAVAYALAGNHKAALDDLEKVLGPIGSTPRYAIDGIELAKYRMQRAFLLVQEKRYADAASEMDKALSAGGKSAVLRLQIFLRRNGFAQTPLDGRDSSELRQSLAACFGLNACFQRISDDL